MERFLTVREAAKQLRVSTQTIYNMCQAGSLRAVRMGRALRIPVSALPGAGFGDEARDKLADVLEAADHKAQGEDVFAILEELTERLDRGEAEREEIRAELAKLAAKPKVQRARG